MPLLISAGFLGSGGYLLFQRSQGHERLITIQSIDSLNSRSLFVIRTAGAGGQRWRSAAASASTFLGLSDVESTTYNGHAGECPWSSMS